MIAAGVPEEVAWDICIPEIDDIDYVKGIKEQEKEVTPLYEDLEPPTFEESDPLMVSGGAEMKEEPETI